MNYSTIAADPPWPEKGGGKIKRGADRHYPVLPVRDIPRVMLLDPKWNPADDAHLYLWVTNNYFADGIRIAADLGFRYVTTITWVKDRAGLGQYFRGQTEHMLFCVRGDGYAVRTDRKDLTTLITAPRGQHSAKPQEAYDLIEARSRGPYLEMFARQKREGWDVMGNEVAV